MKGEKFDPKVYQRIHLEIDGYAMRLYMETNLVRRAYLKERIESSKTELDRYVHAFKRTRDESSRRSAGPYRRYRHTVKFKRY